MNEGPLIFSVWGGGILWLNNRVYAELNSYSIFNLDTHVINPAKLSRLR